MDYISCVAGRLGRETYSGGFVLVVSLHLETGDIMKKNRWLMALAAVGIHLCIGSVYAWSVLTKPVMNEMGLSLSGVTWAFSIAILFLGMSAGFLGGFVG